MGYNASGSGTIKFRRDTAPLTLNRATRLLSHVFECPEVYLADEAWKYIDLSYPYDKYQDELILSVLQDVSALEGFDGGSIEFIGEDDSLWRFEFRDSAWCEDMGKVTYDDWDTEGPAIAALFREYVLNDLEAADTDHVRATLFETLGMTKELAEKIGLDFLLVG